MAADSCPKLPHNQDAERVLLGAVLVENAHLDSIAKRVSLEMFFIPQNRTLYETMLALRRAGIALDSISVCDELQRQGKLEAAGGAAYVASVEDGIPRVLNVEHYSEILARDFNKRTLLKRAEELQQAILEGRDESVESCVAAIQSAAGRSAKPCLRAVSAEEFLRLDIPPREMILDSIIPTQGLMLLYSKRGVGKTYLALAIAHAVSTGGKCLNWSVPKPRGVLYVDGELPASTLRERLAAVIAGAEHNPDAQPLRLITPDLQENPMPDLGSHSGQAQIEAHLDGISLLILDNLSALCITGKENEGESWLPVQGWALRLRQRRISVLFVHHAGKSGTQRGTSRREDLLDTVICLRHPSDYNPNEGLRCEIHFEKCRGFLGNHAKPFEVRMETNAQGAAIWTTRDVEDALLARAQALFKEGLSVRDVAEELEISKSRAHRLRVKACNEVAP